MLLRDRHYLWAWDGPVPDETRQLERDGHCLLRGVFTPDELTALRDDVLGVYARLPADPRHSATTPAMAEQFRYQMFNRSALCQQAMAHARILAVLEPLLGGDCHAISSTAWRNPPGTTDAALCYWHTDGGPYVPRAAGIPWPDAIPYPIFVVSTHIYLQDCSLDDGPTAAVPGSHRSGQPAPESQRFDESIEYEGRGPELHIAKAGDVGFFVSDVWHRRRLPTANGRGRLFLQTAYGRRDIAQRLLPAAEANMASAEAIARARTPRERALIGLHPQVFYDS